jgi:hypothetical protein
MCKVDVANHSLPTLIVAHHSKFSSSLNSQMASSSGLQNWDNLNKSELIKELKRRDLDTKCDLEADLLSRLSASDLVLAETKEFKTRATDLWSSRNEKLQSLAKGHDLSQKGFNHQLVGNILMREFATSTDTTSLTQQQPTPPPTPAPAPSPALAPELAVQLPVEPEVQEVPRAPRPVKTQHRAASKPKLPARNLFALIGAFNTIYWVGKATYVDIENMEGNDSATLEVKCRGTALDNALWKVMKHLEGKGGLLDLVEGSEYKDRRMEENFEQEYYEEL